MAKARGKSVEKDQVVETVEQVKDTAVVETNQNKENVENIETVTENVAKVDAVDAKDEIKEDTAVAKPKAPKVPEVLETATVEEPKEKEYDCLGLKDHKCRIGGTVVTVVKDKYQKFPATIAMVLQTAKAVLVK